MKKFLISLLLICGLCFSATTYAVEEKKSLAVFPLDVSVYSSSYSMYSNAQDMFASDLVNSLQKYNDLTVLDVDTAERILVSTNVKSKYDKLAKEYKHRYVINYNDLQEIADALGVNYITFVYGGFDTEKSLLKSNWKYRCQWIWASPIKPSAQLNINTLVIDVANRHYIFEKNTKKDMPMEDFHQGEVAFAENIVPVTQIKKFTIPASAKMAKKIHDAIYPDKKAKYSQKDAFIEKYTPNNASEDNQSYLPQNTQEIKKNDSNFTQNEINMNNSVNDARKENYKDWVKEQL